jgi:hypothetical protein
MLPQKVILERRSAGFRHGVILVPDPPQTPIAPTTFPSRFNGMPPAKIMILPLLDAWIPKNCPPDRE